MTVPSSQDSGAALAVEPGTTHIGPRVALRQPVSIGVIRALLKHWPLPRGRGVLMRLFGPLLSGNVMMEVERGVVIPVDLSDYMACYYFVGDLERDPAFRFLHGLIGPGDTVFDVGANIGLWALGAARRAGGGTVHAFEPVPENYERLVDNLAFNGLGATHCLSLALSDHNGRTSFYATSCHNSGGAALAKREGVEREIEVTLTTLDEYCERSSITRIDFMKVDVEGAEPLVFRGGARILGGDDAPVIQFEVDESLLHSFDATPTALKSLLAEFVYEFFRYTGRALERVPADAPHPHEDLVALKPAHFSRHPKLRALAPH